jgi:hypothetical protein
MRKKAALILPLGPLRVAECNCAIWPMAAAFSCQTALVRQRQYRVAGRSQIPRSWKSLRASCNRPRSRRVPLKLEITESAVMREPARAETGAAASQRTRHRTGGR